MSFGRAVLPDLDEPSEGRAVESTPPSKGARLSVSTAVAVVAGVIATAAVPTLHPGSDLHSDFDQLWVAARAIWLGQDPYSLIGPSGPVRWPWPLVYPATSAAAVLPVAWMPLALARAVVVGLGAGVLAWSVTRTAWWPLAMFGSAPAIDAIRAGQWSPWLTASVLSSGVVWLAAIKPLGVTLALASLKLRNVGRVMLGGALLFLVATWLLPGWWNGFYSSTSAVTHIRVLAVRPLGIVCLLALLRWRRPEARVLLAVLVTPMTPMIYETLPLLLVARNRREAALLVLLSLGALVSLVLLVAGAPPDVAASRAADLLLLWLFIPALAMLLRRAKAPDHPLWR